MPDLDLAAVIAEVESGNNLQRLRFEALMYESWKQLTPARVTILSTISRLNVCSSLSARVIACTSWGKYQILGENLYDECAVSQNVFDYCADATVQDHSFAAFLAKRGILFTLEDIQTDADKRLKFITAYNGPGNPTAYWVNMQMAIKQLTRP